MNESTKKILTGILVQSYFRMCGTCCIGSAQHWSGGSGTMLLGLAGLIFLLWLYNRQYK